MKVATYTTTKQVLLNAEIPAETRTYKPISHQQLIDLTLESIHGAGFTLDKELYSASPEGLVANGNFTISNVADKEMQLQIGWQNSYNKTLSLKFAIGARIFICQNGAVHGDMGSFKRKHMGEVQEFTPTAITEYIKQAGDTFQKMQTERESMKQIGLNKRAQAELVGRLMLEESLISSMQVNQIAKELTDPTYDYGAPGSLWELYQFTTQTMRETHPRFWISDHMKAHNFFVNEAGLFVPTVEAEVIEDSSMFRTMRIMAAGGDTAEEIEAFRQLSMEF
jgi:hypothetical protein